MATGFSEVLASWAQARLAALYEFSPNAPGADFQTSFDTLFSSKAQILINHQPVALDAFKDDLSHRSSAAVRASVAWKELIEVPKADGPESEAGIVAGCFIITRSMKFRIRAAPAQTLSTVIFSAKIDRDPDIREGDARRIMHLVQTVFDRAAQISLRGTGPA